MSEVSDDKLTFRVKILTVKVNKTIIDYKVKAILIPFNKIKIS